MVDDCDYLSSIYNLEVEEVTCGKYMLEMIQQVRCKWSNMNIFMIDIMNLYK